MSELLIFGGTTEGRELADFCEESSIPAVVSVATTLGAQLLPHSTEVLCGRMDAAMIENLLEARGFSAVIDATHPFAHEATENIRRACAACGVSYYRLLRKKCDITGETVPDMEHLVDVLNAFDGNILSTLGSKSLPSLTRVSDYETRLWVRLIPTPDILDDCEKLGFDRTHVLLRKPPFSVADHLRDIRQSGAGLLVTKESGAAGGYPEKAEASAKAGIRMLTLLRPKDEGYSLEEIQKMLREGKI